MPKDYPDEFVIESLPLTDRTLGCLWGAGYRTVSDVRKATDRELMRIGHFGRGRLREVRDVVPYVDPNGPLAEIVKSPSMVAAKGVLAEVLRERYRQMMCEGRTLEHDDGHSLGELAIAAGCLALHAGDVHDFKRATYPFDPPMYVPRHWPWDAESWKPKGRRRTMVIATTLMIAEIERLDREQGSGTRSSADIGGSNIRG